MDHRFILRRAVDTDNIALSQLNQHAFRETFIDGFTIPIGEDNLQSYFRTSVSPEAHAKKIADPQQATWIIIDKTNNEFVAFTNAGPCTLSHPDVRAGEDAELHRIYVRRDRQGYGLGQWLMNVALSWLEERFPGRPIWVTVWSGNSKAQKLFKNYNFNKVDNYSYKLGEYNAENIIMRRESFSS
ncbi:unnamed protein product [Rotaria sp. Silwood2]|nr:unnamed protein product [Rotaria sp. Silwood2]CAF2875313.1 unnamed protein product [Rotaria sp. Silwood2]CAF3459156.1 unnamed protein product [Rotaria sp. Silwood2]CAF4039527.1 unnamed protein product [Rotaria sp. Silwood2]CAF4175471.1 unnamed protein product [Rotaria sp. Silwood2]